MSNRHRGETVQSSQNFARAHGENIAKWDLFHPRTVQQHAVHKITQTAFKRQARLPHNRFPNGALEAPLSGVTHCSSFDRTCRGNTLHRYAYLALLAERDGVEDHQLGQVALGDAGRGGAGEHAVRAEGKHSARALLQQYVDGLAQRAGGVHHVVHCVYVAGCKPLVTRRVTQSTVPVKALSAAICCALHRTHEDLHEQSVAATNEQDTPLSSIHKQNRVHTNRTLLYHTTIPLLTEDAVTARYAAHQVHAVDLVGLRKLQ
jgi:hypothetical protein